MAYMTIVGDDDGDTLKEESGYKYTPPTIH